MNKERVNFSNLDKDKSKKYLIYGLIVAVCFGTMIMMSKSLNANADDWKTYEDALNTENLNQGVYDVTVYNARARQIQLMNYWMEQQEIYFSNIGKVGVNIGLILVFIGFIGFATNDQMDERTRRISLVFAAAVMFVLMFTTFFQSISMTFN